MIVFVRMKVRPEKRKELSQTLQSIVAQVREEDGCLHADFYQNGENENDFLMVEEWVAQEDSNRHFGSELFKVLVGAGTLLREPPEILIYKVEGPAKSRA